MAAKKQGRGKPKRKPAGSTGKGRPGKIAGEETSEKGGSKKGGGKGDSPPRGSAGDDEHRKRRRIIQEQIDRGLDEAALSDLTRNAYGRAMGVVLARLTPTALSRVFRAVKEYRFYRSFGAMTEAIRRKYPAIKIKPGHVVKGFLDRDGTMHLDGGGVLFGRPARQEEFFAHEMAHALDRPDYEISGTDEWYDAWNDEINATDYLSGEAKRSPQEGFADFGAMLLGSGVSAKQVKQLLPKCVKVWEQRGIL